MGTPDFAVPCLDVCAKDHEVVAVFTQPDRPKGRGKKMAPPAVKVRALELGLPIYQPEKLKTPENVELLASMKSDCIVVVAYGQILSKVILDMPPKGCINVHASLLPKFRGASPIQWSIVQGEETTGVTTMYMDIGVDTGDMILKDQMAITADMTAGDLHDQLMAMGGKVLKETLAQLEAGTAPRIKQDDSQSSHAPLLNKTMAMIDWTQDCQTIVNLVRGMNPWPVATTLFEGKTMKIFSAFTDRAEVGQKPGTIVEVNKSGLYVQAGNGLVRLETIQFAGSKRMHISQYMLGHEVPTGIVLGN